MRIIELQVKNHNKYSLNPELKEFTYRPDKLYQILLGSNGAGKSTTASLIYPYPEDSSVLGDNGHVKQTYEKDNKRYELSMVKNGSVTKYSFRVDGTELNDGGKVTVQQSLVIEHLGIDADIQAVLTDTLNFTDMPTASYKKWVTMLSSTDYDYVLNVYSLVVKKLSYVRNVLKHNNKKRASEEDKLGEFDREATAEELEIKRKHLNKLMDLKVTVKEPEELKDVSTSSLVDYLDELNRDMAKSPINSVDELLETLDEIKVEIQSTSTLKEEIYRKLESAREDIGEHFKIEDLPPKEDLKDKRDSLIAKIGDRTANDVLDGVEDKHSTVQRVRDVVVRFIQQLPVNNGYFNSADMEKTTNEVQSLKDKIKALNIPLTALDSKIKEQEHLRDMGETECPKCEHKWFLKYNPEVHSLLSKDMEDKTARMASLESELLDREKYLEEGYAYNDTMTEIRKVRVNSKQLDDLMWRKLLIEKLIDKNPSEAAELVHSVWSMLGDNLTLKKNLEDLDSINKYLKLIHNIEENNSELAKRAESDLKKDLEHKLELTESLSKRLSLYEGLIGRVDRSNALRDELRANLAHNGDMLERMHQKQAQEVLNSDIYNIKSRIYDLEQIMTMLDISDHILAGIDDDLELYNKEADVLKIVIKELGPESGLIGSSLRDFLGNLVGNMNFYLEQVWAHDMIISPPPVKNNKLSWKFPMMIADNPVPHVSELSRGEKNMVNLAFKLIVMRILGLEEYMLILDEFGSNLDTEHRIKSMRFVSETLREYEFSNIFVISHFSEAYKSFPHSDTDYNALHKINIDLGGLKMSDCLRTNGG